METLIKCDERLQQMTDKPPSPKDCLSYMFKSYRNNLLKAALSATTVSIDNEIPIYEEGYYETYDNNEYDLATKIIKEKFGDNILRLFILHCDGMNYEQLKRLSGMCNLKYMFRRVREYARKKLLVHR